MNSEEKRITVVIPVRVTSDNIYLIGRLGYVELDPFFSQYINVMVVDDGSKMDIARQIEESCRQKGYDYRRIESRGQVFSIARCRNYAAMHATTRYVFFQDADLMPTPGFYKKLQNEIGITGLDAHNNNMIMVPVCYLTEAATDHFLNEINEEKIQYYIDKTIIRDGLVVEKFSSGTSACLYDRYYYLSLGGNREDYSGWGYEDIEFNTRVIRDSKQFPIPADWNKDISSLDIQTEFRGWKSAYRLFGDRSFFKGLLLFHAWHPVPLSTAYSLRRSENQRLFLQHMKDFAAKGEQPTPLPDELSGSTLLFRKNAFTFERALRPLLGKTKCVSEYAFASKEDFLNYYRRYGFTRILFHNPYANEQVKDIYDWAREEGLHFIVAERGALNDSVLFDRTGFLGDSQLFHDRFWNHDLTTVRENRILEYIWKERSGGNLLESQGDRVSAPDLRSKLEVTPNEKLILVCLQRPGDTATRFFQGEMGSYLDFVAAIEKLSHDLPENYRFLFKVHPLETDVPNINGVNVTDYHLYDLFEVVDLLVVFNSGTGVQALMWDLPVVTCGKAFYDHHRLTHHMTSYEDLRSALQEDMDIYPEERKRFLSYLVDEYYSFGKFATRRTVLETGENMTATISIQFTRLRFEGKNANFYRESGVIDDWRSMLFDRYFWQKRSSKASPTQAKPELPQATPALSNAQVKYIQLYDRGCHNFHRGNYTEAVRDLEEAIKLQPQNANVRRVIAEAFIKAGDNSKAIAHLEAAHKLVPTNQPVSRRLKGLKSPLRRIFWEDKPFPVPLGRQA